MAIDRSYPSQDDVKRRIINAICKLYRHDRALLEIDSSERSITHKLAEYLRLEFPNWNVDCEYNRHGYDPKWLKIETWIANPGDSEASTVFPDIIIHRRLTDHNLIVIEVKKAIGRADIRDILKLKKFTENNEYSYEYGFLLKTASDDPAELILFKIGREDSNWTDDLHRALQEPRYGG
jgi:hypothetical protein